MEVKTYRARSMQAALALVRKELGPDAAVLHTREVRRGMFSWLGGSRQIEVSASANVNVPSRIKKSIKPPLEEEKPPQENYPLLQVNPEDVPIPPAHEQNYRERFRQNLMLNTPTYSSTVEGIDLETVGSKSRSLPETMFDLFTDLIDAEVSEDLARELLDRLNSTSKPSDLEDLLLVKARIARMVEEEIEVCGPIQVEPGKRRLVALVGPTGVGKTTTIAKLAANFRLRDRRRVGLITVDTYRIAAVEQLRTYADIIDLPMEVVSTPREMREAVERFSDLDLVLMDTAGRSPRDEVKIQELKSMLGEAKADEVHLVLSSVSGTAGLKKTAQLFAQVGVTSLVLTKLDEATGLGGLLPLLRSCKLPLSYVTNGQNVPDDIEPAERRKLARIVLGMQTEKS